MKTYLGKSIKVVIDRALGTKHPEYDLIYPVNYGYIEGTVAGDGEEIDAYVLGIYEPVETFEGVVIAIVQRLNDVEDKLVVAPRMNDFNKDQIRALVAFQERFFESEIITLDHTKFSIKNF